MKKLAVLVVTALMALCLAGCDSKSPAEEYMEIPEVKAFDEKEYDLFLEINDAFGDADCIAILEPYEELYDLSYAVVYLDESLIPEGAETLHMHYKDYALNQQLACFCMKSAVYGIELEGYDFAASEMNKATEYMNAAAESLQLYIAERDRLNA